MPRLRTAWPGLPALILLVTFPPAVAAAQLPGSVTGAVRDGSTGQPVPGALVELQEFDGSPVGFAGRQAMTGAGGRFALADIPEGTYLVRVGHLAYGTHVHPLRLEGGGTAAIEIIISQAAIDLADVVVEADAARARAELSSPSSRNIRTRGEIAQAAASGVTLGDYLRREIGGISVRSPAGGDVGGYQCIEFRGARREDGRFCRPPEVRLDGAVVPEPLNFFGDFSLEGLERIQVIPPAEAGGRFGANGAWGVILLETRRAQFAIDDAIPVARRESARSARYDWTLESGFHPTGRVYGAALLGNGAGLAAAGALLGSCMDLRTRVFYRNEEYCGHVALLGASIAAVILPPLGAGLAARWAGTTDGSAGQLGRSILYSLPAYVPGFALATVSAGGSGLTGLEAAGLAMVVFGGPVLNTIADRFFRDPR